MIFLQTKKIRFYLIPHTERWCQEIIYNIVCALVFVCYGVISYFLFTLPTRSAVLQHYTHVCWHRSTHIKSMSHFGLHNDTTNSCPLCISRTKIEEEYISYRRNACSFEFTCLCVSGVLLIRTSIRLLIIICTRLNVLLRSFSRVKEDQRITIGLFTFSK